MDDAQDGPPAGASLVFSTERVAIDEWRDVVCGMSPGLSIDWLDDRAKCAWLRTGTFAGARFAEFATAPLRVASTARGDTYHLALLLGGRGYCCRHAGREAACDPRDLLLLDNALPFEAVHPSSYRILIWQLPRKTLAPLLAAPHHVVGARIPGAQGPGAVLGAYARALVAEVERCDPVMQGSLLSHLCGLTALTVGASPLAREREQETRRAVRRQQIYTYIETNFRDPRLTADRAGRELGISQRWLHALLEGDGTSFAARVVRRRLEECRKLLDDRACDHLSITEIALRCGFNDLSTFNRRFRARYVITPRDARHLRALSRKSVMLTEVSFCRWDLPGAGHR